MSRHTTVAENLQRWQIMNATPKASTLLTGAETRLPELQVRQPQQYFPALLGQHAATLQLLQPRKQLVSEAADFLTL